MKKKNTFMNVSVIVLVLFTLTIGGFGLYKNEDFWEVNAAQTLTLIISITLAFWATQLQNDIRKKKDHAEQVIRKIQMIVDADSFVSMILTIDSEERKKRITLTSRTLNNSIDVLAEYGKSLKFEEDVKYIEKEFKDYRDLVSDFIDDDEYLRKSINRLKKYAENIDNKCDQIILKLY